MTLSRLIAASFLLSSFAVADSTPPTVPLWPNGAPGSEGKAATEKVVERGSGKDAVRLVSSIHAPSLTVYLPAREKATGAAMVICPGGGHRYLAIDHEGHEVARWLAKEGIAAFVLKYRLANEPGSTYKVDVHALADARRALRLVRARGKEWGVDPERVGLMGFSAGGELSILAGTRPEPGKADASDPVERQGSRPDFLTLIYPGFRQGQLRANRNTPQTFLAVADDDKTCAEVCVNFYQALKKANVPSELHIYARGGHGFGMRDRPMPITAWTARLRDWMKDRGILESESKRAVASGPARGAPDRPTPAPAGRIKAPKGYAVELIYSVPRETQGSWVNMTVDPKGRLIVSDQYGKLYRVALPSIDDKAGSPRIEPIDAPIGEAHGLLWAFDSLYVVVNHGRKYDSGLYRVRDTDGDDRLDKVELLHRLNGGGEHGPHGVVLAPDGKSLYIVAGNSTRLPALANSLVPRLWGEDNLLPHMVDGSGFMTGEKAPGGFIYRVSPDGQRRELVSMGYRNPFDLAFNRDGELFTYDSDMEWDVNLPWYRPTRVLHAVSGSEFGYRNGSGKWPPHYLDSLPPVANVGPGSPTGVSFGYGAKFPAKYQEALFICDWSYGKLYALHLKPEGSSYTGELEEFIAGTPLALTDVVINPHDGAMYFAVGGRNTHSGLYRVVYRGDESVSPATPSISPEVQATRSLRRKLESLHGKKDSSAVDTAWPYLGHPDRFVRSAARVAVEGQDPAAWRDRALAENSSPEATLNAILALARASATDPAHRLPGAPKPDHGLRDKLLAALDQVAWGSLDHARKLDLLRVYEVVLHRFGRPDEATISRLATRFDAWYPARSYELNAQLCQLLVYLQAPTVATKTIALLEGAPTQEEQIEYASALRMLQSGWTIPARKSYFSWLLKASQFKGGNSFGGFMANIRRDALATTSDAERQALKSILEAKPAPAAPVQVANLGKFVKAWTLDELTPMVQNGLKGRDYDHGRAIFAGGRCFSCHRFNNEGGGLGPDLSGVAGRFSSRDLLESIIQPSKTISDQYEAVTVATTDGRVITGRIVNLSDDSLMINTDMFDPNNMVHVQRGDVEEMKPSPVSMMPDGLLNAMNRDDILDLVAYLMSRGNRDDAMFQGTRTAGRSSR